MIYIALPMASQPRILRLLEDLRDTTASIYFVPDIFVSDLIQARVDSIGGLPVVAVCETPFYGFNGAVKRASDVVLASLILVLIAPLLLAIAIGVKLSSPGPILFKQRRYGLDGAQDRGLQVPLDDRGRGRRRGRQATRNDSRITRFGAFLRRTSLDELPQFINVLQGRMSIVGPRPHAVAHNEIYRKLIRGYMIRHKVKPGITGLAQVNGLRGETDTVEKMKARVEYDLDYLRNWSLLLDLQIILKTVVVVLGKTECVLNSPGTWSPRARSCCRSWCSATRRTPSRSRGTRCGTSSRTRRSRSCCGSRPTAAPLWCPARSCFSAPHGGSRRRRARRGAHRRRPLVPTRKTCMCGIVAAVARRNVVPILIEGLRRLEYRGYDSAGVAVINGRHRPRAHPQGRVAELRGSRSALRGTIGIGHTRWATHGVPSERNAHPHVSGGDLGGAQRHHREPRRDRAGCRRWATSSPRTPIPR